MAIPIVSKRLMPSLSPFQTVTVESIQIGENGLTIVGVRTKEENLLLMGLHELMHGWEKAYAIIEFEAGIRMFEEGKELLGVFTGDRLTGYLVASEKKQLKRPNQTFMQSQVAFYRKY